MLRSIIHAWIYNEKLCSSISSILFYGFSKRKKLSFNYLFSFETKINKIFFPFLTIICIHRLVIVGHSISIMYNFERNKWKNWDWKKETRINSFYRSILFMESWCEYSWNDTNVETLLVFSLRILFLTQFQPRETHCETGVRK